MFIINGPAASGNRLVGAILVRAGCWGEGSTNQPLTIHEVPVNVKNAIWIHPRCGLEVAIKGLKGFGFEITTILVIREPEANTRSMVKAGFFKDIETAHQERNNSIQYTINTSLKFGCNLEIITYEGLSNSMLKIWLPKIGLSADNLNLPLNLVGQNAASFISNENQKYY
jgi:hypothetical protein